MKIYTKTGDQGETGLLGGVRVDKSHPAIEVTGTLDELNCVLGVAACSIAITDDGNAAALKAIRDSIDCIQHDLFELGSRVAACLSDHSRSRLSPWSSERSQQLEQWIDRLESDLPPLTAFILPGGSAAGSHLHLARAVCRRGERDVVRLRQMEAARQQPPPLAVELIYLNRLSDWLFVAARSVNHALGCPETQWHSEG